MTVAHDEQRDGVRVLVLAMPRHLCAYLGLPEGHPLAGFDYERVPLDVHGGLTYSGVLDRPGWWFYGWDYAHLGDEERGWTPAEVTAEAERALYDFNRLARLAEEVRRRAE